jgi:catalase
VITPEQAVDRIVDRFGRHVGARALHAKGTLCTGTFTPTAEAAELTRAAHLQAPVPVIARLSNGGGDPTVPDYAPDVRGLAVSFELPDGARTDLSAQNAPRFPVRTPDAFIDLVSATKPGLTSAARLPLFLLRNPSALRAARSNTQALKAPNSYADLTFYAIHAFRWIDAGGGERWVRYAFRPRSDPAPQPPQGERRSRDFLREELLERLDRGSIRFELELQIAGPGDDPHDPRSVWDDAERLDGGIVELTEPTDEGDEMIFDPMRLTDGIQPSDDPILRFRPGAYSVSWERRTGAP